MQSIDYRVQSAECIVAQCTECKVQSTECLASAECVPEYRGQKVESRVCVRVQSLYQSAVSRVHSAECKV